MAKKLVDDLRAHGNAIKMTDMSRYFAADRDPVTTTYRNYTVYSSAPLNPGGTTSGQLCMVLNWNESPIEPDMVI